MNNQHSRCAHTHTLNAIHRHAWKDCDTERQTSLGLQLVSMPLLGLLDHGQPPFAMLVDRFVQRFDDIDDPGLPVHGTQTQLGHAIYVHGRSGYMHAMAV